MNRPAAVKPPDPIAVADQVGELRALYRLTDKLYRARDLYDVYAAALDAISATLGCSRTSILLFDEAGVMRFVAWRGLSEHYRRALEGHSPWRPGEKDPDPIFVRDIEASDESEAVKATIRREGIRGLGFIPLVAKGGVVGKFMTYHADPHQFDPHEIELAVTIARQVGFSLERAMAERARRNAEDDLRESEERFRLMSEHAPVMIWMSDAKGAYLHLNRMTRAFWDVDEDAVIDFDWGATIHPDDAPAIRARVAESVAGETGFTVKGRFRNAAGEYRVLNSVARPRCSARGEFIGLIGVNVDVTEREMAEAALRASEEQFRLAVEAAPSGMVMTDADGRIVMVNANAERLFGYERAELVGQMIETLVPPRFRAVHPANRAAYRSDRSARPMGAGRELFALRKDGTEVPVEIGLSPIDTPDGVLTIAAVADISFRKAAESQRELLLAELNHRVRNTLAVVQGIAYQTFTGDAAADARQAFEGRLAALAAAHSLLTEEAWQSTALNHLVADVLRTGGPNGHRIQAAGPRVLLAPKEALAMALALHELCTNAVKYGALSTESGTVTIDWRCDGGAAPRLTLVWRERGGPPVVPPARRGFGTFLLNRTLAHDLDGHVVTAFEPEGLVCTIEAPLAGAEGIAA